MVAAHCGDASADQPDDRVAEGCGLPRFGGEATRVEQRFGDCPVTGARQVAVEGTQGRDQTLDFAEGSGRRSWPPMRDKAPEAQRSVGALWGRGVQRYERGHGHRATGRINQPELMIDPVVSDHDVRAVVSIAPHTVAWKIR